MPTLKIGTPHLRRILTAFVVLAILLAFTAGSHVFAQQSEPAAVQQAAGMSEFLAGQLASASEPVSFLVILDEQVDATSVAGQAVTGAEAGETARVQRADSLYRALSEQASASQAPLRAWLDERGVPYRAYYIVNMIEVQGDAALAEALRTLPGVNRLAANPLVRGQEPVDAEPAEGWLGPGEAQGAQSADEWPFGLYGLPFTRAPEVWDLGYTGQGIVVASQDTGVQWDHPALIDSYRGYHPGTIGVLHEYNWFDAWDTPPYDSCGPNYQIPCDDNGHGTHTVGTMVGDATNDTTHDYGIIGMAPDAEWIGCRNMRKDFGTPSSYAACFQFMLAPYPQDGDPFTDGRPELAPHIINNSWSCPKETEGCDPDSLRSVVETARAAGQLVVASASNFGPACSTVKYPIGTHDAVFTVGAHDRYGVVASFSSRGPVTADGSNRLKPDLVAPGVSVLSSVPGGYSTKNGTSMSAPHVAGAAALLWSAAPDLIGDVDLTEQVLIKSATHVADGACMAFTAASPNPTFGYGRLDALAAVTLARTPWTVVVTVTDANGEPQQGVQVRLIDALTRYVYTGWTDAGGHAWLEPVLSGNYSLRVGSGDLQVLLPKVELPETDNPDIGGRSRSLHVTYDLTVPAYLPLVHE